MDLVEKRRTAEWGRAWVAAWQMLLTIFPNSKPSDAAFDLYGDHLADIPAARLTAAAAQCAAGCEFFPTIAALRKAAAVAVADRVEVSADVYGETVRECARALAAGDVPRLDSIAKECVAGMGGAWALVYSTNPETTRAHFLAAHREKLEQERVIASVVPMARKHVPAPPPRPQIGFRPTVLLPEANTEPLTTEEAEAVFAKIRETAEVEKMPRSPAASLPRQRPNERRNTE